MAATQASTIGSLELLRRSFGRQLADSPANPAKNATLHHCDRMAEVLAESARLVRSGGLLIVDHDPQLTAWHWRGLALAMYKVRLPIYRLFLRSAHIPREERLSALATEVHHRPGYGVTPALFTF